MKGPPHQHACTNVRTTDWGLRRGHSLKRTLKRTLTAWMTGLVSSALLLSCRDSLHT